MKVLINNKSVEVPSGTTIAEVLTSQNIPCEGTAIAMANQVVPRDRWSTTELNDGAKITVIRAVCGG